eukprot:scaffold923_cov256-Pinguiococcus_pyrenoidosus.AAC.28
MQIRKQQLSDVSGFRAHLALVSYPVVHHVAVAICEPDVGAVGVAVRHVRPQGTEAQSVVHVSDVVGILRTRLARSG